MYAVQALPTIELLLREGTHRLQIVGPKASLRHTLLGIPSLLMFAFPRLAQGEGFGGPREMEELKVRGFQFLQAEQQATNISGAASPHRV